MAVLFATACIRVLDRFSRAHTVRALVDQGAESSLVSESLVQRLHLARAPTSIAIYGVGGKQTGCARGMVRLDISPLGGGSSMIVLALVLPRLTVYEGGTRANRKLWNHLDGLDLR